ncbi:hypothetical protein E2L08_14945 [Palleronia sediminis]|uniref:Uncharacterized protein n=1 Tax=Palleronia sediminis TaxID=2547833 RepID=A0A4V3B8D9_9RHOB|nr:hypothetical protein [Palleronia sediminis]TDL75209.1 hypothetical protein E2L08_14945 [Palleronia sediminis]
MGTFRARFAGSDWIVSKTTFAGGGSGKLVAEELGGRGYVSLNLYRLPDGRALLRPCEMSEAWVTAFVLGAVPIANGPAG